MVVERDVLYLKETEVIRAAIAGVETEQGHKILERGQFVARCLWNELWWCATGHNRKLARARGHHSLAGRLPKYPGKYGMDKATRSFWAFRELSDRCGSYTVADFDIAMRSWFSNLKSNPDARPPRPLKKDKPRPLRFQPGRNAKHLGRWRFRLTVLGGHIKERHAVIKLKVQPGIKVAQVRLIQMNPDGRVIIMYAKVVRQRPGDNYAAIDQGIINAACLFFSNGESILYTGKGILANDQRYNKKIAKCKPRNYPDHNIGKPRSSKRSLAYHDKSKNRHRLAVHNITRSIVNECASRGVGTIVIGDLRGIRKNKDWGAKSNQWLHRWAFGEFARQIEYKAEEAGMGVVKISERGTSSVCPFCGSSRIVRKPRGLLTCRDCGVAVNSDLAGAANILRKYLPDLGLGVRAVFPGLPSPPTWEGNRQTASRISPTFVAKLDLRNMSVDVRRCGARLHTRSVKDVLVAS